MTAFCRAGRGAREIEYVTAALESGQVSGDGPFTARASRALGELHGGARVLLTTSGTAALELAALLLDVGPGDEVVAPSFTFTSTANAFALRGAAIRFADIDRGTFGMGLDEVRAAVTPRTRVVVAVHYGGVTRDVDELQAYCAERGIVLVEDNAHGLFGTFKGRALGTFGRLSTLSFHATKNVSCGEGGALVVNDASLVPRAEILREKGTDRSRFQRGEVDKYTWRAVGSSFLPSDILAAVLTSQLEDAAAWQGRRHAAWAAYDAVLRPQAGALGMQVQEVPPASRHPAHLYAVLLPPEADRARVLARVRGAGAPAVFHYVPLHRAPAHRGAEVLPVTDDVAARLIRLPLHPDVSAERAAEIAEALVGFVRDEVA